MLPSESSLCTGAQLEPAQLSYVNGDAPGGTSGLAPQRSTTQMERPSLSTATPFSAPHLCSSGSLPQGAALRYGLGRSLVGVPSHFHAGVAPAATNPTIRDRPHLFSIENRISLRTVPFIALALDSPTQLFQKQTGNSMKIGRIRAALRMGPYFRGIRHERLRRRARKGHTKGESHACNGH